MSDPAIASLEARLNRTEELTGEKRRLRLEAIRDDVERYRNNPHIDETELDAIEAKTRRLLADDCTASD